MTALYERARDASAQGPGFALGGPDHESFNSNSGNDPEKKRHMRIHALLFFEYFVQANMRTYKRQTDRGTFSREKILAAIDLVLVNGISIRKAATDEEVNYKTLSRYVKLKQSGDQDRLNNASFWLL